MFENMTQSCLQGGIFSAIFSLLLLALLGLSVAALIKYLFWPPRDSGGNKPGQHPGLQGGAG